MTPQPSPSRDHPPLAWLRAAIGDGIGDDGLDLGTLAPEELDVVATDLEGMEEGIAEAAGRMRSLLSSSPSLDRLEDELIAIETAMDHARWHWNSMKRLLGARGLWDLTMYDDEPA
jgi:hypothetical protein